MPGWVGVGVDTPLPFVVVVGFFVVVVGFFVVVVVCGGPGINQLDHTERSYQVSIMAKIYRSTKESLLWLGEVEDEPIYPFQHFASPDFYDLMLLEEKVHEFDFASPPSLQSPATDAVINVPAAFEVVELQILSFFFNTQVSAMFSTINQDPCGCSGYYCIVFFNFVLKYSFGWTSNLYLLRVLLVKVEALGETTWL